MGALLCHSDHTGHITSDKMMESHLNCHFFLFSFANPNILHIWLNFVRYEGIYCTSATTRSAHLYELIIKNELKSVWHGWYIFGRLSLGEVPLFLQVSECLEVICLKTHLLKLITDNQSVQYCHCVFGRKKCLCHLWGEGFWTYGRNLLWLHVYLSSSTSVKITILVPELCLSSVFCYLGISVFITNIWSVSSRLKTYENYLKGKILTIVRLQWS